ncbi:MAG TPA: glycosyltransferase family 39 protein, partial [Roseiflexaceae bacterium]
RTGLLAAALLAALPFHVRHSQYITVDVACAFMALLAIGAALRILADGRWQTYALAGLAAGLAASTKYHAGLVVLPIALAHLLAWRQASLRQGWRLGIAALASILAFVAATPYALLTPQAFYRGIMIQYVDYRGGLHGNALGRWPLGAYLRFFWTMGLGPLPTLAALLGVGVAVARRDRAALVVLSFVAPFLLFFMVWPQHFWRNLMPIIPPLALFAAIGIDAVAARIASWSAAAWRTTEQACRERFASAAGWLIPLALAALVAGGPLVRSIELDRYNLGDDARMLARSFIQSHLPRGAAVAAELSPPQLAGDPAIKPVMSLSDHDAGWYRERGFRYLVVNGRYHVNDMRWRTAFAQLLSTAALVARFDDRPAHNQIGGATRLARSFASRFCDADVAVLDLQAQATAVPPPIHAELGKSAPCERSP